MSLILLRQETDFEHLLLLRRNNFMKYCNSQLYIFRFCWYSAYNSTNIKTRVGQINTCFPHTGIFKVSKIGNQTFSVKQLKIPTVHSPCINYSKRQIVNGETLCQYYLSYILSFATVDYGPYRPWPIFKPINEYKAWLSWKERKNIFIKYAMGNNEAY